MQKVQGGRVLLLAASLCAVVGSKLPADFQICRASDPDVDGCLKSAIQTALKKMQNGIKELGVLPLEPLTIPSASIGEGGGVVNVVQNYTDFKIHGVTDTKINGFKSNLTSENLRYDIDAVSPEYRIEANYELSGRVLLLPISGKGRCTVTLSDIEVNMHIETKTFDKKGTVYARINEFTVGLKPRKVTFSFENLFNGDERLSKEMNKVLNENWKQVFEDVRPGYERVLGAAFKNYANSIYSKVSYEDLFPN